MRARYSCALCLSITVLAHIVPTQHAQARSAQLWSERHTNAAPLAQVPNFSRLASKISSAVVSIRTERHAPARSQRLGQHPNDPFDYFHRFFGQPNMQPGADPRGQRPTRQGIGTGFVIQAGGLILTNFHVIENADLIEVTLQEANGNERKLKAKVLGTAPEYDVALLQTTTPAHAHITYLGNSSNMNIGDWVMAIGNPFGLSHSVSVGIISAKERRDINPSGRQGLYNFIQTDASINPGNSGGPLINMRGEVIGINTAINAAGSGIGFAIPINMVKEMLPDLKNKGRYTRSWIGIRIQPLTPELAQSYGLKKPHGALISEVIATGPAAAAGLKDGDIILHFDGKTVKTSTDLPLYASLAGVGKTVNLNIWRNGRTRGINLTLAEFPSEQTMAQAPQQKPQDTTRLGITVTDVTPQLQREFRLLSDRGVLIKSLKPGSIAQRAGLRMGDIILQIGPDIVQDTRSFVSHARQLKSGDLLRLQIQRRNSRLYLALRMP